MNTLCEAHIRDPDDMFCLSQEAPCFYREKIPHDELRLFEELSSDSLQGCLREFESSSREIIFPLREGICGRSSENEGFPILWDEYDFRGDTKFLDHRRKIYAIV